MKYLTQAKQFFVTALIVCLCIRVMWWAVAPLLPYLLGGVVICIVLAIALFRTTKL